LHKQSRWHPPLWFGQHWRKRDKHRTPAYLNAQRQLLFHLDASHGNDANDIAVGTTTGTKIGTATSQKIGFFNATPVDRPDDVVMSWDAYGEQGDVSDAQDLEARTALFEIRARLRELGLMATT
jgi:hypothetical protein